jgi:hypothetical protein
MPIFSPLAAVVAAGLLVVAAGLLVVVAGVLVVVVVVVVLLLAFVVVTLLLLVSPPPHALKLSAAITHNIRGRNFLNTYFYSSTSGPNPPQAGPNFRIDRVGKARASYTITRPL